MRVLQDLTSQYGAAFSGTSCLIVKQVPYYVAVNHITTSIVVAIRGRLSVQDALNDAINAGGRTSSALLVWYDQ